MGENGERTVVIEGPITGDPTDEQARSLWVAVLVQAFLDALGDSGIRARLLTEGAVLRQTRKFILKGMSPRAAKNEAIERCAERKVKFELYLAFQAEARKWLAEGGEDFEAVCDNAGVSPVVMSEVVKDAQAGGWKNNKIMELVRR